MALLTLGTNATNSLQALLFRGGAVGGNLNSDWGNLDNLIKDDKINSHPFSAVNLAAGGQLFVPNRGFLQVLPGDYIAVDANGWPVLISAYSIATGGWTHS